jgi:hypothetical protein
LVTDPKASHFSKLFDTRETWGVAGTEMVVDEISLLLQQSRQTMIIPSFTEIN